MTIVYSCEVSLAVATYNERL